MVLSSRAKMPPGDRIKQLKTAQYKNQYNNISKYRNKRNENRRKMENKKEEKRYLS